MHSNATVDIQSSQNGHNTGRELNSNKASFSDIYNEATPLGYYKTLSALGYGDYHDQVTQLINEYQPSLRSGVRKVIDIGCLYGSSAISYAQGAMWSQSVDPEPIRNPEITGVDISENALQFGLQVRPQCILPETLNKHASSLHSTSVLLFPFGAFFFTDLHQSGVFAKIINQNLNEPLSPAFYEALDNADTLLCMMALSYIRDGVFQAVIKRFAASGGKFAIYSTIPIFDDRCYSPEALGLTVKWSRSAVLPHRLLTDAEVKANGGVTASFVRVYVIEF